MRAFLRILTFVLVGPPVGMVTMFSGMALYDLATRGAVSDASMIYMSLISPPLLAICYVFGGVPALLDGILASLLARRMQGAILYFWVATIGAGASVVFVCWVMLGNTAAAEPMRPWAFVAIIAATGAIAGVVSLAIFDNVTRLRRGRLQSA